MGLQRTYFYYVILTTGIACIAFPYVWLTNQTSHRLMIILHAGLLWLWIPPMMTAGAILYEQKVKLKNVIKNLSIYLLSLTMAMVAMVLSVKLITGLSLKSLLTIQLFMGFGPVYTWFLFAWFAQIYRKQHVRAALLQAERDRSAWIALTAQLNPHFLFNTLNTLEHLIDACPDRAKTCLQRLSKIYRRILEGSKQPFVPLREELALVEDYLFLQKERFEEKLEAKVICPEPLLDVPFPPSLLLTCVENAIKHGLEELGEPSPLSVSIHDNSPTSVAFQVENHYPARKSGVSHSTGYGLKHITERLELLYKGQAQFSFSMLDGLATAQGIVPKGKPHAL